MLLAETNIHRRLIHKGHEHCEIGPRILFKLRNLLMIPYINKQIQANQKRNKHFSHQDDKGTYWNI